MRALIAAPVALLSISVTNEPLVRVESPQVAARPTVRLPEETAGLDAIVRMLISAFDHVDVVALGEWHGHISLDSDLRIALIRHPDFVKKVRSIVVEFATSTEQATLDRYLRGENVSRAQLASVWKTTTQGPNAWDSPIYSNFFAAVREVNAKLPADARIRVLGGDPGSKDNRNRGTAAVSVLKEEVLQKQGKALVIYGAAHFYRAMPKDYLASLGNDIGIAAKLDIAYPGRTFVVIPVGPLDRPRTVTADIEPDFQRFDRALKTQVRPVLISLQRLPFRDFSVEEFLGRTVMNCRGAGGCESIFKSSALSLGQMADACIYIGGGTKR
jgi:hypothetical protein